MSPRGCPRELALLGGDAEAREASVTQDVEVVVRLGLCAVLSRLLPAEAGVRSHTDARGGQDAGPPLLLFRQPPPEATFRRTDSERFLPKTKKLQSEYVGMSFRSYSPK